MAPITVAPGPDLLAHLRGTRAPASTAAAAHRVSDAGACRLS